MLDCRATIYLIRLSEGLVAAPEPLGVVGGWSGGSEASLLPAALSDDVCMLSLSSSGAASAVTTCTKRGLVAAAGVAAMSLAVVLAVVLANLTTLTGAYGVLALSTA